MATEARHDGADPYVGQDLGSIPFAVDENLLESYFEGLQVERGGGPGGPTAVPSMILNAADNRFTGRGGYANSFGNLWIRQQWQLHAPLAPAASYDVTARVVDIYDYRDRKVVKQEISVRGQAGELLARGLHHQSYVLHQSSGELKLRDPKAKGRPRFEAPPGEALEPIERTITLEMCGTFFHGRANYHTDKRAAAELGFRDVVVGGRMTISYIGELLERRFGERWSHGGTLDVKFTNIVWPNDRVTARGVISGPADGDAMADVTIWMEKADGTVVAVGSATAPA